VTVLSAACGSSSPASSPLSRLAASNAFSWSVTKTPSRSWSSSGVRPRQPTITGVVSALGRLAKVQGLGGHRIRTDVVPAGRFDRLAAEAFEVRAQRIARRPPLHRRATLAAFAHRLHASAHDDVVDILLLVLGETTGRIERLGQVERLRCLGELDAAALVLAQAARVLLDETVADPRIRLEVFAELARTELERRSPPSSGS
jgi:hypothetical protein